MPAKFEIKLAKNNEYFFHLQAANGEIILVSEMYKTKASAKKGICSVQKNACEDWSLRTQGQPWPPSLRVEGGQPPDHRHQPGLQVRSRDGERHPFRDEVRRDEADG